MVERPVAARESRPPGCNKAMGRTKARSHRRGWNGSPTDFRFPFPHDRRKRLVIRTVARKCHCAPGGNDRSAPIGRERKADQKAGTQQRGHRVAESA